MDIIETVADFGNLDVAVDVDEAVNGGCDGSLKDLKEIVLFTFILRPVLIVEVVELGG